MSWSAAERPAADPAPGEPGHQLLGFFLGDLLAGAQPVSRADLGRAHQADAEQVRGFDWDAGVFLDDVADHLRAPLPRPAQPLPHQGLVAEVGLEHQPVRATLVGYEAE